MTHARLRAHHRIVIALVSLLLASVMLAACSDSEGQGESQSQSQEKEREREKEKVEASCDTPDPALTGSTGLPSDFPTPAGVVYTETREAGPSVIVTGYAESNLESTYEEWQDSLAAEPYEVTKSENDEFDAEVNFSGSDTSGQVKLGVPCTERTSVVVTVRPG